MKTKGLLNVVTSAVSGIKVNDKDAQNILFKDGYLYSWSAAIAVSAKLPNDAEDLTGIINGEDLVKFLSKLNKEEIEVTCDETEWVITSDSMTVKLTARNDNTLADKISKLSKEDLIWEPLPSNFYQGLAICDIPNNTKKTSGVFIGDDMMVSTDNIRLNRVFLDSNFPEHVWLSQFSVSELRRLKQQFTEYAVSKRWIHFRNDEDENGVQLEFACNRLDDTVYDYKLFTGLIDKSKESAFAEGELPDLTQEMALASCFDDCVSFNNDKDSFNNIISLTFDKEYLKVSSERRASGTYSELVKYPNKSTLNIEQSLTIKVTSFFLMEACKYSKHFSLSKVGKNTLIRFFSESFDSIVLVLV